MNRELKSDYYPKNNNKKHEKITNNSNLTKLSFLNSAWRFIKSDAKLKDSLKIFEKNLDKTKKVINNNLIFYGAIQSGKTTNMLVFISFLLDNNFDKILVFTGNTNDLNIQSLNRFKEFFKNTNLRPEIWKYEKNIDENSKQIITLKKNDLEIKKIIDMLYHNDYKGKIAIIDDECDYNSKDKIQKLFLNLNEKLNGNRAKYFGFSATPYWNLFSKENKIIINHFVILSPGKNYQGPKYFLNNNKKWNFNEKLSGITNYIRTKKSKEYMNEINNPKETFTKIIEVILSCWEAQKHKKDYQILINVNVKKQNHEKIKHLIEKTLFGEILNPMLKSDQTKICEILNLNRKELESFIEFVAKIRKKILIINSDNPSENLKNKKILIGGFKLSRGNTFKYATHFVITRFKEKNSKNNWPSIALMLQNCRWYGYDKNDIKIFTTRDVYEKYKLIHQIDEKIKEILNSKGLEYTKKNYKEISKNEKLWK